MKVLNRKHRSALAKFRAGVAPIRLETGRYEGLDVDEWLCPICTDQIESEEHVITRCPAYNVPREVLYNTCNQIWDDFNNLTDSE